MNIPQLIQNMIGTPNNIIHTVDIEETTKIIIEYDLQYILGGILIIFTLVYIYKLLIIFAKGLGRLKE